MKRCTDKDKE